MTQTTLGTRQLYGGAISMDLPVQYGDASDLRQIPDNQEVFLSPSSDTSLVIEVLGLVEEGLAGGDLWEAAKFHFNSIAHDNSSLSSTILTSTPPFPLVSTPFPSTSTQTPTPTILCGTQSIHKFSHDPSGAPRPGHESDIADTVFIGLALWRIWLEPEYPNHGTNINTTQGGKKKADVVCSVNVNLSAGDGRGQEERNEVEDWWRRSIESLRIVDFDLFGDEE